jgi:tRNA A-37 threonylcarbamoyl transferase component Bud32
VSHTITACSQCGLEYASGEVFCPNDGARLAPKHDSAGHPQHRRSEADALVNQVLGGRYKIIRKIGEGGMGIVYEAEHVMIEKRVGLKVLREDFSSREDVVERFRQEAKSASRIGHPNIIDISDFGVTPSGANYFVMELLSGHDLATELEKKGPLQAPRAMALAVQCARALGAAHAKGIVHRDMKPENIFLLRRESGEDYVKIVDFGIAKMSDIETDGQPGRKLTKTGMIFGTPEYMSPEQAGGKKLDHRVDIYAMGIILYELLTGRVPFVGDTFMGILTQHMFETAAPIAAANPAAQVPPELERIIFKALAKNPDDRYQSMEELANDLLGLSGQPGSSGSWAGPVASSPPPPGTFTHPGYQEQRATGDVRAPRLHVATPATELTPEKRASSSALVWVAVAVALLGGGGFFALRGSGAEPAPAPAAVAPATPAPAPAPPSAPPPVAPAPAPSTQVTVHVDSEPEGARVVAGGKEVCSGTPCDFPAERGKEVEVELSKNGFRPTTSKLTPLHDSNQITVSLKKRERAASPGGSRKDGDLKIPDALIKDAFSSGR